MAMCAKTAMIEGFGAACLHQQANRMDGNLIFAGWTLLLRRSIGITPRRFKSERTTGSLDAINLRIQNGRNFLRDE